MELPLEYTNKMTELLGKEEFARYRQALDSARAFGIRVNTLKITTDEFIESLANALESARGFPGHRTDFITIHLTEKVRNSRESCRFIMPACIIFRNRAQCILPSSLT